MSEGSYIALRLLCVLPAIFVASYLAVAGLMWFVAVFWPFIIGAVALVVGFFLLAAHVS